MAHIYPPIIAPDTKSAAERKLYKAFEEQFDDQWTILHHVKWIAHDERNRPKDGETDFIVAHPRLGILIIEVKGGRIHFNQRTGRYISTDRNSVQHDIGDPFEDATGYKHTIIAKLKRNKGWPKRRIFFGHAVAFPDNVIEQNLRPNAPREIIIDTVDMPLLENRIRTAFQYWKGRSESQSDTPPGSNAIDSMIQTFALSNTIRNPLMAESARIDEHALVKLTEKQFRYLRFLSGQRRAAIAGCAGSGKTFLAMEKARQLATEGLAVLFCCYNRALSDHLGTALNYRKQFDVFDFHQLCLHWINKGGHTTPQVRGLKSDYFTKVLPDSLITAIDEIGPQYDAIIVDEGQDFRSEWWDVLPYLLTDPDNGIFYIFFDNNQQVYFDRGNVPIPVEPFSLDENCRNTQRVFSIVNRFYTGTNEIRVLGPPGLPVETFFYDSHDAARKYLRKLLHRLIQEEGFSHDEIVVLSALGQDKSTVLGIRYGNIELSERLPIATGEVLGTTIRKFKGLERSVVILCEIDDRMTPNQVGEVLYVGTSRAKTHLIMLIGKKAPSVVRERLRDIK